MKALLLFLLVIGTAKWSESMTLTPYSEDDCSGDDAIRYDGDFFYQGMKVNEHRPQCFDFSSEEEAKPRVDWRSMSLTIVGGGALRYGDEQSTILRV